VGEVVDLSDERTVLIIEPSLTRPELGVAVTQVPLADDGGLITGSLEGLTDLRQFGGVIRG